MNMSAKSRTMPQPGQIIDGRFEIVRKLGQGGMSAVYAAKHLQLKRMTAVKFLLPTTALSEDGLARFQRECVVLASLEHPNILGVYAAGSCEAGPYIALEYLEGISLQDLLAKEHRLPREQAVDIFIQILRALECAHEEGVVHRDLKPGNIMLVDNLSHVKVVDFGLARVLPQYGKEYQTLTQTGEMLGTVTYMSPEQCLGRRVDARSDLYSFGCIMYEVLSGVPAVPGDNAIEAIARHMTREPDANANIPEDLDKVIRACMAKEPDARPQSAREVIDALRAPSKFQARKSSAKMPAFTLLEDKKPRRNPVGLAILVFVAAICLTAAFQAKMPKLSFGMPRSVQLAKVAIQAHDSDQPQNVASEYTRQLALRAVEANETDHGLTIDDEERMCFFLECSAGGSNSVPGPASLPAAKRRLDLLIEKHDYGRACSQARFYAYCCAYARHTKEGLIIIDDLISKLRAAAYPVPPCIESIRAAMLVVNKKYQEATAVGEALQSKVPTMSPKERDLVTYDLGMAGIWTNNFDPQPNEPVPAVFDRDKGI